MYDSITNFILTSGRENLIENTVQSLFKFEEYKEFPKLLGHFLHFSLFLKLLNPIFLRISNLLNFFLIKFLKLLKFSKVIELILLNESCIGILTKISFPVDDFLTGKAFN